MSEKEKQRFKYKEEIREIDEETGNFFSTSYNEDKCTEKTFAKCLSYF